MKTRLQPLLEPKNALLACKRISLPAFNHPYHHHPQIEVTYVEKSGGTLLIGDHLGPFTAGELYLLGPNLPHVFRNMSRQAHGACAEVLHIAPEPLGQWLSTLQEMRDFAQLIKRSRFGLVYGPEISEAAKRHLQAIRMASGIKRMQAFFGFIQCLLEAPEPQALASPQYKLPLTRNGRGSRIDRVCDSILESYDKNISHSEMATKAHMSKAAFSRLFRRTTGKTFTQFLTEVRIGHASLSLLESDRTIAEIAFASGFNNLANFNRKFREYHHCSPREYRASVRSF